MKIKKGKPRQNRERDFRKNIKIFDKNFFKLIKVNILTNHIIKINQS